MRIVIALLLLLFSSTSISGTPNPGEFSLGTSSWIQHGLVTTVRNLDLAIQGQGFFALQAKDGGLYLTRHGSFSVNKDGFVVYGNTDLSLLSPNMRPLQISSSWVNQIGIALAQQVDLSSRTNSHLFRVREPSDIYIGLAGQELRGVIYQSCLEELDEYAYFLFENKYDLPSQDSDREGFEIDAEMILKSGSGTIRSKRLRIVDAKDQWWQLSADDRAIWYGRLSVADGIATVKSIVVPGDFSCAANSPVVAVKLGEIAEMQSSNEQCSWTMKLRVNHRERR